MHLPPTMYGARASTAEAARSASCLRVELQGDAHRRRDDATSCVEMQSVCLRPPPLGEVTTTSPARTISKKAGKPTKPALAAGVARYPWSLTQLAELLD
jgi:hypothetical protein